MENSSPLLATKLYIPSPRPQLVRRARLIARLDDARACAPTLISAPVGFGETTLTSDWIAQKNLTAAWVSPDENDNDPARDWNRAGNLVEKFESLMYAQNELPTIVTWVMTLPDDLFQSRPSLALKAAWAWLATTHVEEAEHALQAVVHAVHLQADVLITEPAANLSPQVRAALVEVTVIRASIMMPQFDFAEKIKRLERVLPWLTDDAPQVNNRPADLIPLVIFSLALAHELIGNSHQASQLFACPTPNGAH